MPPKKRSSEDVKTDSSTGTRRQTRFGIDPIAGERQRPPVPTRTPGEVAAAEIADITGTSLHANIGFAPIVAEYTDDVVRLLVPEVVETRQLEWIDDEFKHLVPENTDEGDLVETESPPGTPDGQVWVRRNKTVTRTVDLIACVNSLGRDVVRMTVDFTTRHPHPVLGPTMTLDFRCASHDFIYFATAPVSLHGELYAIDEFADGGHLRVGSLVIKHDMLTLASLGHTILRGRIDLVSFATWYRLVDKLTDPDELSFFPPPRTLRSYVDVVDGATNVVFSRGWSIDLRGRFWLQLEDDWKYWLHLSRDDQRVGLSPTSIVERHGSVIVCPSNAGPEDPLQFGSRIEFHVRSDSTTLRVYTRRRVERSEPYPPVSLAGEIVLRDNQHAQVLSWWRFVEAQQAELNDPTYFAFMQ